MTPLCCQLSFLTVVLFHLFAKTGAVVSIKACLAKVVWMHYFFPFLFTFIHCPSNDLFVCLSLLLTGKNQLTKFLQLFFHKNKTIIFSSSCDLILIADVHVVNTLKNIGQGKNCYKRSWGKNYVFQTELYGMTSIGSTQAIYL